MAWPAAKVLVFGFRDQRVSLTGMCEFRVAGVDGSVSADHGFRPAPDELFLAPCQFEVRWLWCRILGHGDRLGDISWLDRLYGCERCWKRRAFWKQQLTCGASQEQKTGEECREIHREGGLEADCGTCGFREVRLCQDTGVVIDAGNSSDRAAKTRS